MIKNSNKIKYMVIQFNFKSFHPKLLKKSLDKITKKAKLMNINIRGLVFLPLKTKRFTVLRSPHVYKKSREQFEIKTHHRAFITFFDLNNLNDQKKAKLFINFAKSYCVGLQLKITYKNIFKSKPILNA